MLWFFENRWKATSTNSANLDTHRRFTKSYTPGCSSKQAIYFIFFFYFSISITVPCTTISKHQVCIANWVKTLRTAVVHRINLHIFFCASFAGRSSLLRARQRLNATSFMGRLASSQRCKRSFSLRLHFLVSTVFFRLG